MSSKWSFLPNDGTSSAKRDVEGIDLSHKGWSKYWWFIQEEMGIIEHYMSLIQEKLMTKKHTLGEDTKNVFQRVVASY